MTSLATSSQMVTEYVVRVPKNTSKRYNIMAFNAADKVNFSTWHQARLERDLSNRRLYQEDELPEAGAGSEFHRRLRDEARRRKLGIVLREFRAEEQPWLLRVNGRTGRRYRGVKKGGVTENASYYVFTQCPDGAFEAFPVLNWFNFTPLARHRTLTAEEAEEEWERRNKVLNHFSIMQQRRLRDQDEEEEEERGGRKVPKKGGDRDRGHGDRGDLRIHDLEDDLELSSEESEGSEAEGDKVPKRKAPPGGRKRRKKKKGSEDEAFEDSDDGDFEGQEVDYMSDASSSQEEEEAKAKVTKEDDGPKGIDEASESSEESEEEKAPEEKEEEEEEKKVPTPQEKKKKKDSSDESQTSEESDIDSETSSALFMAKKKTPRNAAAPPAARGGQPPGDPPGAGGARQQQHQQHPARRRLQAGARPPRPPGRAPAKRPRADPAPPSGKSTPSSGEVQLTEEAVRRYLGRKPMTTKDLLKKFQTKRTGLSSDATVNVLAQILKRLNPERKVIGDKMHFFLKE
ncbi:general transcription factor IIF subunit 1 isoform X2 [Caloenas nicobarica]|uniref:general transcription factor IIF subunit 1 isoform X2 n=1 Tax=Caloenas nicobarica TaxID=187106 RepID=UPI0032B80065